MTNTTDMGELLVLGRPGETAACAFARTLRHLPNVTLLRLQVNTLAGPTRRQVDDELLDAIGREWARRNRP